eukprot:751709-Hanusia_phi.AAC.1
MAMFAECEASSSLRRLTHFLAVCVGPGLAQRAPFAKFRRFLQEVATQTLADDKQTGTISTSECFNVTLFTRRARKLILLAFRSWRFATEWTKAFSGAISCSGLSRPSGVKGEAIESGEQRIRDQDSLRWVASSRVNARERLEEGRKGGREGGREEGGRIGM